MSSVTPLDTSAYSAINSNFFPVAPMDTLPASTGRVVPVESEETEEFSGNNPDLSNYYNNVHCPEVKEDVASDFVKSAGNLENAMVSALVNGYSVQDACNIKLAECAYKANASVLKSTFELKI